MNSVVVAALYKFVNLPDYRALREPLLQHCLDADIRGTLLLAGEGINGTVAGTRESIDGLLRYLKSDPRFSDLRHKESYDSSTPFYRMKVKLKREIVTMGVAGIDPNQVVGTYVEPADWNRLVADPDVVLVDTRNQYEVELGTFRGAINPQTRSFREFPAFVERHFEPGRKPKVAMFCTGGIRCEKSTAYLKQQGFDEVYHLKGGILQYLEDIPAEESLWQGECFVFDNRVTVDHGLSPGQYDLCHGCREPVSAADKTSVKYIEGVACPGCYDRQTPEQRARFQERQKQMELSRARKEAHIGAPPPRRQQKLQSLGERAVKRASSST